MKKSLVLLSGGMDSTVSLFWTLEKFDQVEAIGFNYGQKHAQELEQAKKIAKIANVDFKIFDIKGLLSGSSLTDHSQDVSAPHKKNNSLPSSFTAGRNALFLSIAASYGYEKDILDIITGVCQTDYSGYPDCRRNFIDSQQLSSSLAMGADFRIHTPLMYLTKAETWKLASDLTPIVTAGDWEQEDFVFTTGGPKDEDVETGNFNVIKICRDLTLTDYNGDMTVNEWGMGKLNNPASQLRKKGFDEAKEKGWI